MYHLYHTQFLNKISTKLDYIALISPLCLCHEGIQGE